MFLAVRSQLASLVSLLHLELEAKVSRTSDMERGETIPVCALDASADALPAKVANLWLTRVSDRR